MIHKSLFKSLAKKIKDIDDNVLKGQFIRSQAGIDANILPVKGMILYTGMANADAPLAKNLPSKVGGVIISIGYANVHQFYLTHTNEIYKRYGWFEDGVNTTWTSNWAKVYTTTIPDVPFTKLNLDTSKFALQDSSSHLGYCVRNGICYVVCKGVGLVNTGNISTGTTLPPPVGGYASNIVQQSVNSPTISKGAFLAVSNRTLCLYSNVNIGPFWGTLTYMIAED